MQYKGKVKKYIAEKRYGFIQSEEHDSDVFFHYNGLAADTWNGKDPSEGDLVTFKVEADDQGRNRAVEVALDSGEAAAE